MKKVFGVLVAAALVVVGCTQAPPPAEAPAAPDMQPYANLAQLMRGIPFPASNIIFDAQTNDPGAVAEPGDSGGGAVSQYGGIYGGWEGVANAALSLQEVSNLLLIPGRLCENGKPVPSDQADFQMWAQGLADAGGEALKAAQAQDLDAMLDVAGTMSDACLLCHEKYRDVPDNADRCTP
jgi:hypothetical protein